MQWSIHSKLAPLAEESEEECKELLEHESPRSDEQEVHERRSSYEYESSTDAVEHLKARPKRPGDECGYHGDKYADDVDRKRQGGSHAQLEPKPRTIPKAEQAQDERSMFPVRRIPRQKHRQAYDSYAKQYQRNTRNALQGNGNRSIENERNRPEVSMSNEQYSDDETGNSSRYHSSEHQHRNKHRGGRVRR